MSAKNINFEDKKPQKSEFHKNKKITKIDDIDVNKILVSKKESYGTKNSFKYFIGHNDNDVIRPLCIRLQKRLLMLKNLVKMQQCHLRLIINNF